MGLSTRGNWCDDMTCEEVLDYYINAIEAWRTQLGLTDFILVGHSFGGYIAAHYTSRYIQHVRQLIFLSAAGVG